METKPGWIEKRKNGKVIGRNKVEYRVVKPGDIKGLLEHPHYKNTTVNHLPKLSRKSSLYRMVTKDILVGELGLLGETAFTDGMFVEIGLDQPKYKTVLKFLAVVVHTESYKEMGRVMHHAGVMSLAVNKDDLDMIERFLYSR